MDQRNIGVALAQGFPQAAFGSAFHLGGSTHHALAQRLVIPCGGSVDIAQFLLDRSQLVVSHRQGIGVAVLLQFGQDLHDGGACLLEFGLIFQDGCLLNHSDCGFPVAPVVQVDLIGFLDGLHGVFGVIIEQVQLTGNPQPGGESVLAAHLAFHRNGFLDKLDAWFGLPHSEIDGSQRVEVAADQTLVVELLIHLIGPQQGL